MIELHVSEYCENCSEFEPYVDKFGFETCGWNQDVKHDTIIICRHRHRCDRMVAYLESEIKGEK